MDLINSLNNQLFDFSEVLDANDLIRKIRTDLNVFFVDGFVFKLVSNFHGENPVFDYLSGGQHAVCDEYERRHWDGIDPFFLHAQQRIVPFDKINEDDLNLAQQDMVRYLNESGYKNYCIIPLHSKYGVGVRFAVFYLWSKLQGSHAKINLNNLSAILVSYGYYIFDCFVELRRSYFMKYFEFSDVDLLIVKMVCSGLSVEGMAVKLNVGERMIKKRIESITNIYEANGESDFFRASTRFMLV
ncbi:hypothetical protein [Aquitalea pelogenes]|uniref:hypothetical protein n=1 Tax=Aquitalea pelogenes TaxID=1293573 RepID=UPI00128F8C79|nr:hypothetical protein [Aquitalea pelogenes]